MYYETKDHHGLRHNPFKALIAPRPVGWISSLDSEGVVNLAPFSYFNAVASDPPVLIFSAGGLHIEGGLKDTVANVEATGEFVHNVATWETREAMNATSAALARKANEQIQSKVVGETLPKVHERLDPASISDKIVGAVVQLFDPNGIAATVGGKIGEQATERAVEEVLKAMRDQPRELPDRPKPPVKTR